MRKSVGKQLDLSASLAKWGLWIFAFFLFLAGFAYGIEWFRNDEYLKGVFFVIGSILVFLLLVLLGQIISLLLIGRSKEIAQIEEAEEASKRKARLQAQKEMSKPKNKAEARTQRHYKILKRALDEPQPNQVILELKNALDKDPSDTYLSALIERLENTKDDMNKHKMLEEAYVNIEASMLKKTESEAKEESKEK